METRVLKTGLNFYPQWYKIKGWEHFLKVIISPQGEPFKKVVYFDEETAAVRYCKYKMEYQNEEKEHIQDGIVWKSYESNDSNSDD